MPIYDDVSEMLKEAMRARDAARLAGLRGIRAGFILALKEDGSERLDDDRCLAVLRQLARQRKDSIEAYAKGGRQDLVDQETAELRVIESFLPLLADEATTREWVRAAITAAGASSGREVGKVMGQIMRDHKGQVDANLARRLAAELLG